MAIALDRKLDFVEAYQALLEHAPDAILVVDPEPPVRFVAANAAAERLLGYSREALAKIEPASLVLPADMAIRDAMVPDLMKNGAWRGAIRMVDARGGAIEVDATVARVQVAGRTLFQAFVRDLTEQRRAEQALQASEERYRALVHLSPHPVLVHSRGKVVFINPAGLQLIGATRPDVVVGQSVLDLIHPDERKAAGERIRHMEETGKAVPTARRRWLRLDGEAIETESVAAPITWNGNRAYQVTFRDVTLQTRFERRQEGLLRAARRFAAEPDPRALLQSLLDEARDLLDGEDGLVRLWDAATGELRVYLGSFPDLARYPVYHRGEGLSGRAFQEGQPVIVNDFQTQVGKTSPASEAGVRRGIAAPLIHEGRALGTISVLSRTRTSFTQQDAETLELLASLAAAALDSSERSRLEGVLLAARTLEHELNNQLALVAGYAELLGRDPALPERLKPLARDAQSGAQAASRTMRQLLQATSTKERGWGEGVGTTLDLRDPSGG